MSVRLIIVRCLSFGALT